jgi:soluble lytic murein transglycosylase-like protein
VLLALSISPAWCPEAPVIERLQQAMLGPSMDMSADDMIALLASHDVRHLPKDFGRIAGAVNEASRRQGVSPELVLAVIEAESEFRGDAVSNKGAVGLMQLMPDTAEELAAELDMRWTGEDLLLDPSANINLGTFYLRKMMRSFDDLDHALAAYNRGPYATPPVGFPIPGGETAAFTRRVKELLIQRDSPTPARSFGEPNPFKASAYFSL